MLLKQKEAERLLEAETTRVATQTLTQTNARFCRLANNVAAEFDERQRIYFHEFSVVSCIEAQREVLTHDAAEEIHRTDGVSEGMMRTKEFESHSEVSAQRKGFEMSRDYHQKSPNASNEEHRKYYNLL